MLRQQIEQDLKSAMLASDARRVSVLRSLKSAITYAEVAAGTKGGAGLSDDAIIAVFAKEAKKRQESADSYLSANSPDRAQAELAEKKIIEVYLPAQLSEEAVRDLVEKAVAQLEEISPRAMGQVITDVKRAAGAQADGSVVARLVKERLQRS